MAQIFKPSANTLAKLSLIVGAALPVVLLFGASTVTRSSANTKVGVPIEQPIPFSHRHHAFELGIDCRYCHYTVERGNYAGLPSTEVCMSCHSQIWTNSPLLQPLRDSWLKGEPIHWNKVVDLPDFAYFDHSLHISRGINCNICHGAVQDMALTYKGRAFEMIWCLTCHREPEKYLYKDLSHPDMKPSRQAFELYWKWQSNAEMTVQERSIMKGDDLPKTKDAQAGIDRVKELGIKTKQLEDCAICHR